VEATPVPEAPSPAKLTPERFETEVVRRGQPIVLRGLSAAWPARNWDFPRIAGHFPDRPLRANGVAPWDGLEVRTWRVSIEQIERRLQGQDALAGEAGAARPDWLFDLLGELPELVAELPPPNVHRGRIEYRLFMGCDTYTPGHHHSYQHALISLVFGKKRVILYPPSDSRRLYPYPVTAETPHYQSSRVDFGAPDLQKFPKMAGARPLEANLEPGDGLFIPVHWWHAVYGTGAVLSTSVFWNARLRDFCFPHPGFQTLAGMLRWQAWPRIRGLTRAGGPHITP
jgi:hypothetical protein